MKERNKKPLIFVIVFLIVGTIAGVTLAYYTTTDTFSNRFDTSTYGMVVQEKFQSPDNWKPGDTTPKTVTATNTGEVPAAVRIKLTPSWVDKNGDPLDIYDENNHLVALINYAEGWDSDWIYQDGYYYYNGKLNPNEITPSLIESVTYNPNAVIDSEKTCTEDTTTHKTKCVTRATGYAGGTYTLTIDVETIQYDKYQEAWNTSFKVDEDITEPKKLYTIIQEKTTMDNIPSTYVSNNGIDYSSKSSDTNGKGVYTLSSTANNDYPIMFYRGDVKNNYLAFANKCWKIVRTTDTGGTKILYDGDAILYHNGLDLEDYDVVTNRNDYLTFDSKTTLWEYVSKSSDYQELSFKVPEGDNYILSIQVATYNVGNTSSSGGSLTVYKNGILYFDASFNHSSILMLSVEVAAVVDPLYHMNTMRVT